MNWLAVNTKPWQEGHVESQLRQFGVETFFPRIRKTKVIRRKRVLKTDPLFPGYLFVRCNMQDNVRAVSYTRGVRRIVTFGTSPATVSEEFIEGLQCRLENDILEWNQQKFSPGQHVRIHEGALYGLEAVFQRELSDSQRAVLLVRALAYQARVVIPLDHVVNLD